MQAMHRLPITTLSRRAITGVLLLWLCVVATSVWAPVARAQMAAHGMERLCSGHGAVQWVPSPVVQDAHGDAAALHHLIDCPLCLPVLAPPPGLHAAALSVRAQHVPPAVLVARALSHHQHWPPARGPPLSTTIA